MKSEILWKPVEGYDGKYIISNTGKIFSKNVQRNLEPWITRYKYLRVELWKDGKKKQYLVHRLVALTFIKNTNNKPQINHRNGVRTDNHVNNLEWATNGENQKHSYDFLGKLPTFKGRRHTQEAKEKVRAFQLQKNRRLREAL